MTIRALIFLGFLLGSSVVMAYDDFTCSCVVSRPGYESGENIDKICDYACNCKGYAKNQAPKEFIHLEVTNTKTTARSFEMWDFGSHICHGQYAYRPTLSSPNWQIEVRFSPFTIHSSGNVEYEELVEISSGVKSTLRRTKSAPEVLDVLSRKLLDSRP